MENTEEPYRKYLNNFILGKFKKGMDTVVDTLVDTPDERLPVEYALDMIDCNEWFSDYIQRSIIMSSYKDRRYYNQVKPHRIEVGYFRLEEGEEGVAPKPSPHFFILKKK